VHSAALSPSLLESELFGHVKGAFTGAHRDRIGRFELADGGTLFLDEIGDISLETQIKLLRVLQTRAFEPVGGTRTIEVDVRLITATHQDLKALIGSGRFREDLYYRLNVISIELPGLAERREDIVELAVHFLQRSSSRLAKTITNIDEPAVAALLDYDWPGNIRELENAIERAAVLTDGETIVVEDLPDDVRFGASRRRAIPSPVPMTSPDPGLGNRSATPVEMTDERDGLLGALRDSGGNKARAARSLGIPRSTFFSKLKKHGID
jgi:DNA-binding NtrC family response regulator